VWAEVLGCRTFPQSPWEEEKKKPNQMTGCQLLKGKKDRKNGERPWESKGVWDPYHPRFDRSAAHTKTRLMKGTSREIFSNWRFWE